MQPIRYYSTNQSLPEGFKSKVNFKDALFMGLAPDSGLFMPDFIPMLSDKEIIGFQTKTYPQIAESVLSKFLNSFITSEDLKHITESAYDFDVPFKNFNDHISILYLDKGPTASFKDFAARMMAQLMANMKDNKRLVVLVATSGDTGSAVGEAYHNLEGISVFILYPEKEVSAVQKHQLDSIGDNVISIAVDAKFDDCQKLVKQAFADTDLRSADSSLTSANSINIGRLLPQIVYYFYAYSRIARFPEPVMFSVPSGNFGNSMGCEIARRMGLPVSKLIIAVNENDEFPRFLQTSQYHKLEPSRRCLSNAMNVGNPSNLARFFDLYHGTLDNEGIVHKVPDLNEMKKNIFSISISDQETGSIIHQFFNKFNSILDPHGAVGVAAAESYIKLHPHDKTRIICIETADPAKFPEIVTAKTGKTPEVPASLSMMKNRKASCINIKNNYHELKHILMKRLT